MSITYHRETRKTPQEILHSSITYHDETQTGEQFTLEYTCTIHLFLFIVTISFIRKRSIVFIARSSMSIM